MLNVTGSVYSSLRHSKTNLGKRHLCRYVNESPFFKEALAKINSNVALLKHARDNLKSLSFKYFDNILFLNTLILRNCENIAAQRVRRIQQVSLLYSRLWGKSDLKEVAKGFRIHFFGGKRFLFGSLCLVPTFDWNKERIKNDEIESYVGELDYVKQLFEKTVKCLDCKLRKCIDQADPKIQYCKCQKNEVVKEDEWQPFCEKSNVIVWRRYRHGNLYEYKVHGVYPDISANTFLKVQLDCNFRKSWDDSALEMKELDRDPLGDSVVLYWKTKYPFPMSNREYVFKRRHYVDHRRKVMVILNQAVNHPEFTPTPGATKVHVYKSVITVRPLKTFNELGIEFCVNYYDEPGTNLPCFLTDWVASSGLPGFMEKVRNAAKSIDSQDLLTTEKNKTFNHEGVDYKLPEQFQGQQSYA